MVRDLRHKFFRGILVAVNKVHHAIQKADATDAVPSLCDKITVPFEAEQCAGKQFQPCRRSCNVIPIEQQRLISGQEFTRPRGLGDDFRLALQRAV